MKLSTKLTRKKKLSNEEILEIYRSLKPNHLTKDELLLLADKLEYEYNLTKNANFIRKIIEVYENENKFKK